MSGPLLIDAGNTRFKWAEVDETREVVLRGELETALVSAGWINDFALPNAGRVVVVASVVPEISILIKRALPAAVLVNGDLKGLPLAFDYQKPSEIGADRIASAIGAGGWAPAVIINCGTATAFSAIDRRSRFCGGAILPGLQTQLRSLQASTAQLPLGSLHASPDALGKSTAAAITAGVVRGWRAAVVELASSLKHDLGGMPQVVVTGGEAHHLRSVSSLGDAEFRPLLVFEGLRIIADRLPKK